MTLKHGLFMSFDSYLQSQCDVAQILSFI